MTLDWTCSTRAATAKSHVSEDSDCLESRIDAGGGQGPRVRERGRKGLPCLSEAKTSQRLPGIMKVLVKLSPRTRPAPEDQDTRSWGLAVRSPCTSARNRHTQSAHLENFHGGHRSRLSRGSIT